jgi:hypothetical protein
MATERHENLGPAEHIIQTLLQHSDHMIHGRPGMVTPDPTTNVGVRWDPVTTVVEADGKTYVYKLIKKAKKVDILVGDKKVWIRGAKVGELWKDNTIRVDRLKVAEFRPAGIFPEIATWMYSQVAEVWKLDNEFVAKWASYAFAQDHKDLKVVLAAFSLVQSRKGDPVMEGGKILFQDDDFREVGEAMCLITQGRYLNARQLLGIRDLLTLGSVAEINRTLGFGKSARKPFLGRWPKAVEKWLAYRENNPQMLDGLVKGGFSGKIKTLARLVHYKPLTPQFFEKLGWKQAQSKDGHRALAIGQGWAKAETWEGQTEEQICQRIVDEKLSWKVIVSRIPTSVGVTRAIMAAAVESGCLSDKELVIATPTLENLGLLQVQEVRERWQSALSRSEDQRAANIALNVKNKATKEALQDGADIAIQKAVAEVSKGIRVYVLVDTSSSMGIAIEKAKSHIEKFLQGFKPEQIHACTFNTSARQIDIRHASRAGVEQAFRGISAGGGTDYGSTLHFIQKHPPKADEDAIFIFVGDEDSRPRGYALGAARPFTAAVRASGIEPLSFGLVYVPPEDSTYRGVAWVRGTVVQDTAAELGIPCFQISENTFEDPYAIPRTIRNLIAATPVGKPKVGATILTKRKTLVDEILETKKLQRPSWAA